MKTTSHEKQPQNIKSQISQQPLMGYFFTLTFNPRRQPIEDDLKLLKVEHLSNN